MFSAEDRAKAQEAKRRALPKGAYAAAIKSFCEECGGVNPAVSDCDGAELLDGTPCRLYAVNTRFKRKRATKTALKRAIKGECRYCMNGDHLQDCSSPACALFQFGPGTVSRAARPL